MADELSLPRLAWNATSQSRSSHRKRIRLSSPPVSSDPAIFSSDDVDASADNYTQERIKKRFRGPWYQQIPASEAGDSQDQELRKSKRIFERKFDSGIFMGSDVTDEGDAIGLGGPSRLPFRQMRTIEGKKPSSEDLAQQYIARCLEAGLEAIDLSSYGLRTLSNTTIRPLASFTRVPEVADNVFAKLEPKLKLFLASNELSTLPAELFKLDNLTALSLRANRLLEIPPGIGNLAKLKELNLSQNGLRFLPYEILDLFSKSARLQSLNLHPNVFYEPIFPVSEMPEEPEVPYRIGLGRPVYGPRGATMASKSRSRECHEPWKTTYQGRTEVRFFDIAGKLVKGPEFPSPNNRDSNSLQLAVANKEDYPEPPLSRGNGISHAPSLVEVALLACGRSPQLPQLASLLPPDSPQYMREALLLLEEKKESGGSKCTICKRNFIIKRTEWIEWWEISKVAEHQASAASPLRQMERDALESKVPLIRRGCSWFCLPEKVTV